MQLRLFSVKEGEPGENTAAKIQNATNKLNEIHGELKKWHPESGEKLEKQNDIVSFCKVYGGDGKQKKIETLCSFGFLL